MGTQTIHCSKRHGRQIVLGIDAAWTERGSSGIALVCLEGDRASLLAAAPSYSAFCATAPESRDLEVSSISTTDVLNASSKWISSPPDLVAIDMPLSRRKITGRRTADNAVSSAYGRMGAGTHSPSASRPGVYGRRMQSALEEQGYTLQTSTEKTAENQLIEVYPHPALIHLCHSDRRLEYKASKCARYWPHLPADERRKRLLDVWAQISRALEVEILGAGEILTQAMATSRSLKAVEDVIDAIVCAWVGVWFLRGSAAAFGDADAAIWIPSSSAATT